MAADKPRISQATLKQMLDDAVHRGDGQGVRAVFNSAFWMNEKVKPEWQHVRAALVAEDKTMLKLLVNWGGRACEDEMVEFKNTTRGRYVHYARLLRQAGYPLTPAQAAPWQAPTAEAMGDLVNPEWKSVLAAFHKKGYCKAIIAGGALRDLFNGKPDLVNDVDIFLPMEFFGSKDSREAAIFDVFKCIGLAINNKRTCAPLTSGYGIASDGYFVRSSSSYGVSRSYVASGRREESLPSPVTTTFHHAEAEGWKVRAGEKNTEYNIIFVKGAVPDDFTGSILNGFDIGICQVAYDGKHVVKTQAFDVDFVNKSMTLVNPDQGSRTHLSRIYSKYPDWTLCDKGRALLGINSNNGPHMPPMSF